MRELTTEEVQDVNGGVAPVVVAVVAVLNTEVSAAVAAGVIGAAAVFAAWAFS
ncbi:MAG: class IIb bacteriocin, lactobin A/cerein 7B family [bacterium]|jgi:lactobin A/cerein 7B family class IIb bacteriocin